MIVVQEEEEIVDIRENKRFRATHGEMVAKDRVLWQIFLWLLLLRHLIMSF